MIVVKDRLAHGIDVSNNNGHFPWQSWRGHVDFAAAKSSEGLWFEDSFFAENWEGMEEIGVWRFAYHFVHPENGSPAEQAKFFTDSVRSRVMVHPHDHFMADIETRELSPADQSWWTYVFHREMNRLNPGHRIVTYTNPNTADGGYTAKLGSWHLWEACYGTPSPPPCGPWKTWAFWQYSAGPPDLSVFNGDHNALEKFMLTTG